MSDLLDARIAFELVSGDGPNEKVQIVMADDGRVQVVRATPDGGRFLSLETPFNYADAISRARLLLAKAAEPAGDDREVLAAAALLLDQQLEETHRKLRTLEAAQPSQVEPL